MWCDPVHYHVCTISSQSAQWFRAVPSRPTQIHYSPEWPLVSLVSLSLGYQVTNVGVSRLNIPQHRSCHETPRPATIYVIIRDGTVKGYLFGVTIYSKSKVDHAGFNSTTLERFAPEYKASCQSKRIHIRSMVTIH